MNLGVILTLTKEGFDKGISQVSSQINRLRMHMIAMMAIIANGGLSIADALRKIKDTTRDLESVRVALRNITDSTSEFSRRQAFLSRVAQKYGMDIMTATREYAKFSAAAKQGGMSIADQERTFEGVNRAIAAFSLSSEESGGVLNALTQMMGKGKLAAEELRIQMGEKLPIAIAAMARANGGSVSKLEEDMRKGTVVVKEILPKFAEELTKMTEFASFDNLETSFTKLQNRINELIKGLNLAQYMKAGADGAIKVIDSISRHIWEVVGALIGFFSRKLPIAIGGLVAKYRAAGESIVATVKARELTIRELMIRESKIRDKILSTEAALAKSRSSDRTRLERQMANQRAALARTVSNIEVATEEYKQARLLSIRTAGMNSTVRAMYLFGLKMKTTITSFLSSTVYGAIAVAIGWLIGKIVDTIGKIKEARELSRKLKEYDKDIVSERDKAVAESSGVTRLKSLISLLEKREAKTSAIASAEMEVRRILGLQKGEGAELIRQAKERLGLLEKMAKNEYHVNKFQELVGQIDEAERDPKIKAYKEFIERNTDGKHESVIPKEEAKGLTSTQIEERLSEIYKYGSKNSGSPLPWNITNTLFTTTGGRKLRQERLDIDKYRLLLKERDYHEEQIDKYTTEGADTTTPPADTAAMTAKESPIDKARREYKESLRKAANKLQAGAVTQEEYNKEVSAIASKLVETLSEEMGAAAKREALYAEAREKIIGETKEREATEALNEYAKGLDVLREKHKDGAIKEDEYIESVARLAETLIDSIYSSKDATKAEKEYAISLRKKAALLMIDSFSAPYERKRDGSEDWKKSTTEIAGEYKELASEHLTNVISEARKVGFDDEALKAIETQIKERGLVDVGEVKKLFGGVSNKITEALTKAIVNSNDRQGQFKLAEVKASVKRLDAETRKEASDSIKNVAGGADRLVRSLKSVRELIDNPDVSEWEKLIGVFNSLTQAVDTFNSISEGISKTISLMEQLSKAKQAEAAISKTAAASEVASSGAVTAAKTTEAASKAAAAHAGMPFVGVALAATAIAGLVALISRAKFANGGVVGGNSFIGDRVPIMVNSGELILNQAQQGRLLYAVANGGAIGSNRTQKPSVVSGTLTADGSKLRAVLKVTERFNSRT